MTQAKDLKYRYMDSPIGQLLLAGAGEALEYIGFPEGKGKIAPPPTWQLDESIYPEVEHQLSEYFAGQRQRFDLPLKPNGTEFQLEVLDALLDIPYGETRSYGDIANQLARPKAVRAVGAANGRNPIPIIIPCHRVIGSNGSLTGFGGGLPTKQFLLALESEHQFALV